MSMTVEGKFRLYRSIDVTAENLDAIGDLLGIDKARLKVGKTIRVVQDGDVPITGPYKGQSSTAPKVP